MKVLIVDDTEYKIEKIKTFISGLGYDINLTVSSTVFEGLSKLKDFQFDLVILDLQMPYRNNQEAKENGGIKFVTELNRHHNLHRPKTIIGLTSHDSILSKYKKEFETEGWLLISFDASENHWKDTIQNKITYLVLNSDKTKNIFKNSTFLFGLSVLTISFLVLLIFNVPTEAFFVLRIIIALSSCMVATILPGMLSIESRMIKATGGIAFFVLIYLWNPPELIQKNDNVQKVQGQKNK